MIAASCVIDLDDACCLSLEMIRRDGSMESQEVVNDVVH